MHTHSDYSDQDQDVAVELENGEEDTEDQHVKVKKVLYKNRKKSGTLKGVVDERCVMSSTVVLVALEQQCLDMEVGRSASGNRLKNLMEIQNLILLLQSLLGKLWDKDSSPLLVFEDTAGEVFMQEPTEVQKLPHQHLGDPSTILPPLGSLAPLTKHTLPLASSLSEEHEHKSDLNRISLDIVPQSSLVGHSYWASLITAISGLDCISYSISFLSWWWETAKLLFFSTWVNKSKQEHLFHHPSDVTLWVDPTRWQVEPGGLSFINSDVQTLLEMLITKRVELKVWNKNSKNGSSFKQMSPDYTLYSLGNMLESLGSKRDTTAQTFWNTKEKPEKLHDSQNFFYNKDLGGPLEKKYSQLFWGLPSLHSESLVATAWVSKRSSTAQCKHVAFNKVSESLSVQYQDEEPPQLSQEEPLAQEEAQSQFLTQNLSPSVALGQTLASISYTFPNLPPSSSQIKSGTTSNNSEKEAQSFLPTEDQHSECPLQNRRKWKKVLFSEIKKTLEVINQPALNLPQRSGASQISNFVSIVAGDSANQELEKRLQQHIQGELISDQPQLDIHCRFLASKEQMHPQDKFPGKSQWWKNDKSGSSQPSQSALTDNDLQKMEQPSQSALASNDLQKMETKHSERLSTMGSITFKLEFPNKGLEPELQKQTVDLSWSSGSTSGKAQNDNKEVSESYLRRTRKDISQSDLSTGLEKKIVEKILQDHLSRKLVQIKEGMIPVCVRGSWLAANYALPKYTKPIYLASSKYQQSYVNTVKQLSFLDPGTHLKLETDIMRSRVRHRWNPSLQALDTINCNLGEAQTSPLPQPAITSSASSDYRAISIAKIGSLLEELPQKGVGKRIIRKISFPTLQNPLPAPSPSEVQSTMQETPLGGSQRTSDACIPSRTYSHLHINQQSRVTRGIGKASLEPNPSLDMTGIETQKETKDVASEDPCSGMTMLEIKVGTQSTAGKTKETDVEKKSCEWEVTVGASVMANSQTINVNVKNIGSLGNMNSPSPSRISISQDPGDQILKENIGNVVQLKVEFESEEQETQEQPQDIVTRVLQDCHTNELSTTDILPSQVYLSNSKSFFTIHKSISQALCDDEMKAESSQEQEESKVTNVEVPGKEDTEKICINESQDTEKICINESQESFGRSRPKEEEEISQDCGLSPFDKVQEINTTLSKSFPCLPEKGQIPPVSYGNIKMKDFMESFNNHQKGKGKENSMNKVNLLTATTHTQKLAKRQISKDSVVVEPQALVTVVGQILMDKLGLQRRSGPTEVYGHKEPPTLLGRQFCQPRGSSYPDKRQMFREIASRPQASPNVHSPKNKWIRDNNWSFKSRNVEPQATGFQLRSIGLTVEVLLFRNMEYLQLVKESIERNGPQPLFLYRLSACEGEESAVLEEEEEWTSESFGKSPEDNLMEIQNLTLLLQSPCRPPWPLGGRRSRHARTGPPPPAPQRRHAPNSFFSWERQDWANSPKAGSNSRFGYQVI
ncbi:spermatogenesis-associated protein 31E1-like [Ictidomys tridecemlineatus]|nr:spermatogenesis-associated protein 31E1-like [Ictidomys tridecemlineatus]